MKKGFTLAEVLITLAIIGVVAALTIPSVISNNQQQEYKTGLRKAVSVLNSAIQANIAKTGETPYDNYDLSAYLRQAMSVVKTGGYSTCYSEDGSLKDLTNENGPKLNCYSDNGGTTQEGSPLNNKIFYTTDGMRFEFSTNDHKAKKLLLHESGVNAAEVKKGNHPLIGQPDVPSKTAQGYCGSYGLAKNPNNTPNTPCVIMVDVNGDRKPNPPKAYDTGVQSNQTFVYSYADPNGKKVNDIFSILITDEKAIPFGVVAQRAMYGK